MQKKITDHSSSEEQEYIIAAISRTTRKLIELARVTPNNAYPVVAGLLEQDTKDFFIDAHKYGRAKYDLLRALSGQYPNNDERAGLVEEILRELFAETIIEAKQQLRDAERADAIAYYDEHSTRRVIAGRAW